MDSKPNLGIALTDMSEKIGQRDVLYLFACHLEWLTKRNPAAYEELLAALDDHAATFAALQNRSCTEVRQGGIER